ncbi:Ankyrin repeat and SOCS box protein 1, partial [Galemys pyrenaicus]
PVGAVSGVLWDIVAPPPRGWARGRPPRPGVRGCAGVLGPLRRGRGQVGSRGGAALRDPLGAGPDLKAWLREQFCDRPPEHCADTRLHDAAYVGDLPTLRSLLQEERYRGRINEKSVWCCGWLPCTPLRLAATAGHSHCVDFLIRKGAEVDLVDVKGQTALYVAVVNGHLESAQILLEAGADPNGSRHHRSTPVYHAARVGRADILQALIRSVPAAGGPVHLGAGPWSSGQSAGRSSAGIPFFPCLCVWKAALSCCLTSGRCRPWLLRPPGSLVPREQAASAAAVRSAALTSLCLLGRHGADVDVNHHLTPDLRPPFSRRLTSLVVCPLYISAAYHNLQCFRLLLQAGADPDFNCSGPVDTQGFCRGSPACMLDAVLRHGCEGAFVRLLVEFGANLSLVQWESLGSESRGRRKVDPEALQVFQEARSAPQALLGLCRVAVRRALGKSRLQLIPLLPLPAPIKKFLLHQ